MSSQSYKLYYKSCLDFSRTIVIKSEQTAETLNEYDKFDLMLREKAGLPLYNLDEYDKRTWRYYMHLAGIPHEQQYRYNKLTNQKEFIIKVISLDTHELIDFTVENLQIHRATARDYTIGSTYYRKLLEKYPEHIDYIKGVINPVDLNYAIEAKDNTILAWDARYVEDNEYSLIQRLQDYVYRFYDRWNNTDYCKTEDLYTAARIGVLYIYLPFAIMNIRYDLSRSMEAHTFHVWNFLGSHQYLDVYKDYMTVYQRLWFYRNMRWVESNPGKMETFRKLIHNVMTVRNLSLAEFHVIHKTELMESDMDTHYPYSEWKRDPLNLFDIQTREGDIRSVRQVMEQEYDESRDNKIDFEGEYHTTNKRITTAAHNNLPSKVLEARSTDYSKIAAIKKHDVELNEWIYLASQDMYIANIIINDPNSSNAFNFNMKEALITYIYAVLQSHGLLDDDKDYPIPTITASKVIKNRRPTIEEVAKLISLKYTPMDYVHAADHYAPLSGKIISTARFAEFCEEVYQAKLIHRNMYSFVESYRRHPQVKTIVNQYYETVICQLAPPGTTFKEYFKQHGYTFSNYNREHWSKLGDDILKYATGNDLRTVLTVSEIQGMMVRLLKQLSSYSVQFLKKVEDDDVDIFDIPYIRYELIGASGKIYDYTKLSDLDYVNHWARGYAYSKESLFWDIKNIDKVTTYGKAKSVMDLIDFGNKCRTIGYSYIPMPDVRYTVDKVVVLPGKEIKPAKRNAWDLSKFKIHKTTEDRSRVVEDENGNLIIRGVVYVDKNYKGK